MGKLLKKAAVSCVIFFFSSKNSQISDIKKKKLLHYLSLSLSVVHLAKKSSGAFFLISLNKRI